MPQSSQLLSAFTSAPGASLALTGASAGASAYSQYESGAYGAQVARNNQVIANSNADLATFRGNQEINNAQQRTVQMIGAQRAGAGASGVDVNSGSPLRAQEDTARIGAMDVQTIRDNAARSAWGFRTQAQNFGNEGKLDRARGDQAAFASLIGGGSNFADKWSKYQQSGGQPSGQSPADLWNKYKRSGGNWAPDPPPGFELDQPGG